MTKSDTDSFNYYLSDQIMLPYYELDALATFVAQEICNLNLKYFLNNNILLKTGWFR